jgi:hypothetical protein
MRRILPLFLLTLSLTACADRIRYNCDDLTNPNGITERRCP